MFRSLRPLALLALACTPALAQSLEVPAPSTKAKVEQRVGLTDFSVEYSSPAMRGRKIFGETVRHSVYRRSRGRSADSLAPRTERTVTHSSRRIIHHRSAISSML